jgi:hypothetical protein
VSLPSPYLLKGDVSTVRGQTHLIAVVAVVVALGGYGTIRRITV